MTTETTRAYIAAKFGPTSVTAGQTVPVAVTIAAARREFAQRHLMPWPPPCPWPPPVETDRRYNVSAAQRAVARKARSQCPT